jgi:hypothetical protein
LEEIGGGASLVGGREESPLTGAVEENDSDLRSTCIKGRGTSIKILFSKSDMQLR